MQQYLDIKQQYRDCILFFRLGDFYEMFFDDAVTASKAMEVTLTGKNCGMEEKAPMCGVPYHAADTYIAKLIEKGYKVAVCEQTEDPAAATGIVKREVIRIVTPGTVVNQGMLDEKENNYLASVYASKDGAALTYCDISTGELMSGEFTSGDIWGDLLNELIRIDVRELRLLGRKLFDCGEPPERDAADFIEGSIALRIHPSVQILQNLCDHTIAV